MGNEGIECEQWGDESCATINGCLCRVVNEGDCGVYWSVESATPFGYVTVIAIGDDAGIWPCKTEQEARDACERAASMIHNALLHAKGDANAVR